jgi:putative sigma-54 modulation protein
MNISITFRHMEPSDAIKAYAQDKVSKLQKFLRQPMTAKVTLSLQKLRHVAETRVSSGGEHIEAMEASEDIYASIDKMIDKLERQIRGTKGAQQARKRGSETVRGGGRPKALEGVAAELPTVIETAKEKPSRRPFGPEAGKDDLASASAEAKVAPSESQRAKRPAET